jgi:hypothetical protein
MGSDVEVVNKGRSESETFLVKRFFEDFERIDGTWVRRRQRTQNQK